MAVSVGTVALAAECIVANKPDGKGNFGDVVINPGTGAVSLPSNPGGQCAGGFVDVYLDLDGNGTGDILLVDDTFVLKETPALGFPPTLPDGALEAGGPGRGVDD